MTTKPKDVITQIKKATRRQFSAEEKIRIVLEGLRGETPISEIYGREGIASSVYYKWSKVFPWCPMVIEWPDNSAIRSKAEYDRSNLQPSQAFLTAIGHIGLVCEVFAPSNKNYSCTS